jgi:CDP-4-dehydro-6-deoxyglucose reductase/ferredoxin-NAD(P)+ reductase (naphthalene dioxygenase ferredoxin-specific)
VSFAVTVKQYHTPLKAEMGDTILQAALNNGREYPHGCQSGNCGACKSRLYSGDIQMSPYSEHALSQEEKESGLILACRAVPWSDCEVAYLEQDELVAHPLRELICVVTDLEHMTHDITRIQLSIETGGPFNFTAGQYAHITFKGHPQRDYSMANQSGSNLLEFHVRKISGGKISNFVNKNLKIGDVVRIKGPYGISYYRRNHTGPILAIAGSTGLAPIKSIIEKALEQKAKRRIHLYIGVRDTPDLYLIEHFKKLMKDHSGFSLNIILSESQKQSEYRKGYLADAIAYDFDNLNQTKVYLAGPPIMVETCINQLRKIGVQDEDFHADAFYTEADKALMTGTL